MLKDEQAAWLLHRVETALGKALPQVRGNLRMARNRSAAVWELLVVEAANQIGPIEYEPNQGKSPDIRLNLSQSRPVWLEASFLYDKFWEEERKSYEVTKWIFGEAARRGITPPKIIYRFDGDSLNPAGPRRKLPALHEIEKCLNKEGFSKWLDDINSRPHQEHVFNPNKYSIRLRYAPNATGPHVSGGGLVQEAAKTVTHHVVYRKLIEKAKQCKVVVGPSIVCIASDKSSAVSSLSSPGHPTFRDAVMAAFSTERSLSAAIIVHIRASGGVFERFARRARAELFFNENAKEPLTEEEVRLLLTMDFNRWKYTYPLEKWEQDTTDSHKRVTGTLTYRWKDGVMEIEVPANVVIEALAGKTTLAKAFDLGDDHQIVRSLREGWVIESCSWKNGNIESGEAPKIVLDIAPPIPSVYWPKKESGK